MWKRDRTTFESPALRGNVLDFADFFQITLRNDHVLKCEVRWDEFQQSLTKIPTANVLASPYKLRRRVYVQLKTVSEVYDRNLMLEN